MVTTNVPKLTMYHYTACGTCRKAEKHLRELGRLPELIPIVEQPPTLEQFQQLIMQSGLELKKWFNTSGEQYKLLGLKDKLRSMSAEEQMALLASNGKLVKRPVVTDGVLVTVGYHEETFNEVWGK